MAVNILPEIPETYNFFGVNLTGYMAQPGSYFQVNRYGFDTGVRKFLVNTDVADLGSFVQGSPDFKYPRMFVNRLTNEVVGGPWTAVTVEYLGLLFDKPTEHIIDTDIRRTSINVNFVTVPFDVPEITVQSVYVTSTYPDPNQVGTAKTPDIAIPTPTTAFAPFFSYYSQIVLWQWLLRKRAIRIAGTSPGTGGTSGQWTYSWIKPSGTDFHLNCTALTVTGVGSDFTTDLAASYPLLVFPGFLLVNTIPQEPITTVTFQGQHTSSQYAAYITFVAGQFGVPVDLLFSKFGFDLARAFVVRVNAVQDATHATIYPTYSGWTQLTNITTDQVFKTPVLTALLPTSGTAPLTLYEVTDSYKRIVGVFGEPIANALSG